MPQDNESDHTLAQRNNGTNGHYDVEHKQEQSNGPLIRSRWRAMVQDFTPLWFTWCMNSGIISILLHQHPYQFSGIYVLSDIFFVVDLVLFIAFTTIFLLRFAMFRSQAFYEITNDIQQLPLLACWVIAYLTLPSLVSLNVSQVYWGGYWAMMLSYVMWWFGALWTFIMLTFIFIIIARRHLGGGETSISQEPMPPLVVIPAVSVVTCALIATEVASYSNHMNSRLAVPVIIVAFPLVGIGMTLACFLYTILFRQLLENGFPPPAQVTSMFVWIGPFGQSAATLQGIGMAAQAWFREYNRGTFITQQSAQALNAACTLGALLLLGPAVLFLVLSIYVVFDVAISTRKVTWTPSWNAIIFPWGTLVTATTYFSLTMNSPTFRVLTSIQLIILVILYLMNLCFTLLGIYKGELLGVKEDYRVKQQMESEQKGK